MTDGAYEGIAIVGMAGRFPGAETVEELWANLVAGRESVSFFDDDALAGAGLSGPALRSRGHYVPARGVLKDADCFDAAFFGVHPKEAEVMDPQQRLFLEICWAALEQGWVCPEPDSQCGRRLRGRDVQHLLHARAASASGPDRTGRAELVMFGNEKDYLATRVAYKLGLKGPAVNVSTACSTSLVAVAQACQSLLTYQCDMALAGGSSVTVPQKRGYFHDEGNIGSADGHTRTFDAQSSGTAFSNGVAVVVLKRLADAVDDGDQIYAVIKAAALNNDGSHIASASVRPGVEGQSEVIAMAHALAGVDPDTIGYVEAHGTATPLGRSDRSGGSDQGVSPGHASQAVLCLGSVKTNLGHLDVAAGVTGLIKTALSLHHGVIPASLHFTRPNPKLELENSPFYVNATLRQWHPAEGTPRRAGVSSFGTGGTNAHVDSRGSSRAAAIGAVARSTALGVVRENARSAGPGDDKCRRAPEAPVGQPDQRSSRRGARRCCVYPADWAQRVRPSAHRRLPRCGRRRERSRVARREACLHAQAAADRSSGCLHVPGPGCSVCRDGSGTLSVRAGVSCRSGPLCGAAGAIDRVRPARR